MRKWSQSREPGSRRDNKRYTQAVSLRCYGGSSQYSSFNLKVSALPSMQRQCGGASINKRGLMLSQDDSWVLSGNNPTTTCVAGIKGSISVPQAYAIWPLVSGIIMHVDICLVAGWFPVKMYIFWCGTARSVCSRRNATFNVHYLPITSAVAAVRETTQSNYCKARI